MVLSAPSPQGVASFPSQYCGAAAFSDTVAAKLRSRPSGREVNACPRCQISEAWRNTHWGHSGVHLGLNFAQFVFAMLFLLSVRTMTTHRSRIFKLFDQLMRGNITTKCLTADDEMSAVSGGDRTPRRRCQSACSCASPSARATSKHSTSCRQCGISGAL